jgi:hypothetical protein
LSKRIAHILIADADSRSRVAPELDDVRFLLDEQRSVLQQEEAAQEVLRREDIRLLRVEDVTLDRGHDRDTPELLLFLDTFVVMPAGYIITNGGRGQTPELRSTALWS